MAASLTALRKYTPQAVADLNAKGDALRHRLNGAGVTANGSGSLIRLLVPDPSATWWALYRAGVLVGTNGLIALSTAMTADQIGAVGDAVIATLSPAR